MSDAEQKSWLERLLAFLFQDNEEERKKYLEGLLKKNKEERMEALDEKAKDNTDAKNFISENRSAIKKDLENERLNKMLSKLTGKKIDFNILEAGRGGDNAYEYTKEKVKHLETRIQRLNNVQNAAQKVLEDKTEKLAFLLAAEKRISAAREALDAGKLNQSALDSLLKSEFKKLKDAGYLKVNKITNSKEEDIKQSINILQRQTFAISGKIVVLGENNQAVLGGVDNPLTRSAMLGQYGIKEGDSLSYKLKKGLGTSKKLVATFREDGVSGGLSSYSKEKANKIITTNSKLTNALSVVGVASGRPANQIPRPPKIDVNELI